MNAATTQTARIEVYSACDCGVCASGRGRWFSCRRIGARFVATYDCDSINPADPQMGSVPSVASVRWVATQHPGCVLVFDDNCTGREALAAAARG